MRVPGSPKVEPTSERSTEPQTGPELEALAALHAARAVAGCMEVERDEALDRVAELEGLLLAEKEAHAGALATLQLNAAKFGFCFSAR